MAGDRTQTIDRLRLRLLSDAGTAGWGYYSGKASRVEPTCWALLALAAVWNTADGDREAFQRKHLAYLTGIQRPSGLLVETDDALANMSANGLALIALAASTSSEVVALRARLLAGVVAVKGVRLAQSEGKQNDQLQGWPWVRDTFSWVEPTAWCLLGLKKAASRGDSDAAARTEEAERLLLNRVCTTGGWNYGNANTLGQDLRPYVPTTAIGLLAMQDRPAEREISRSSQWLAENRLSESSTLALALTSMSLKILGLPADDVNVRLMDVVARSEASGHMLGMAMAAYALSADLHNVEALRVRA